ncbi:MULTISPECIES: AraC family transcriptional regulator [Saccharopolyspora]|uniref:HTH-type transcriptional regulator RipA n=1 Tax=Saccharopolyspora elongata TaxID=2530387 RepID=A0A4R4YCQ9_9PSEU|nr:helix-turn-helix transcriptional regulator [Saccharopolyspora elongata]TDD42316.1 AraC family transcriptional regulator [Saccharopolyspora elongata]
MYGKSEDREDYQDTPRAVAAMARDLPDRHYIPTHSHRRGQLVYGTGGTITVTTPEGTWVVPPQRAVWVPPRVPHAMRTSGHVPMRTLYIDTRAHPSLPVSCTVMTVSPLLRELVSAAARIPVDYDESGRDGKLMSLLIHELVPADVIPLHLPVPKSDVLERLCARIIDEPGLNWTLGEWAAWAHLSERTLARRFQDEFGCSFARWRQQARLLAAVQMLGEGKTIATVAGTLGYESPSAFTAMFRKALGKPPTQYFEES